MAKILIIQGSLSSRSKTALLVDLAMDAFKARKADVDILDLRRLDMQFCDGRELKAYNGDVQKAYRMMEAAEGYVFGMPVYCWSLSGALKNLIDLTAGAMENKMAGIMCNAGSSRAYLVSSDLVKILSFESAVLTVHPIVSSSSEDFENGQLANKKVLEKINAMSDALLASLSQ